MRTRPPANRASPAQAQTANGADVPFSRFCLEDTPEIMQILDENYYITDIFGTVTSDRLLKCPDYFNLTVGDLTLLNVTASMLWNLWPKTPLESQAAPLRA